MFKTTGIVDKEFLSSIKAYVLSPRRKCAFALVMLFDILCLAFSLFFELYLYAAIFFLCDIVFILEYYFIRNRTMKLNLNRMAEMTGKEETEYTVFFEDDGVVVENHSIGANCKIAYDKFVRLAKRYKAYALFTKTNQCIPIFVDCLSDAEKVELLSFLKAHNPKLK